VSRLTYLLNLLFRPYRFFERGGSRPLASLLVVALFTVVAFGFGFVFFEVLLNRIDGTVMVDNPAYPGDAFCQGPFDPTIGDCDAPREVERNIDTTITDVRGRFLVLFLFVPVLGWLVSGLFLHVGSWLAGDEGTVKDSFAVAAWGLAPSGFSMLLGMAVLWVTFDPITVTPESNTEEFLNIAMAELEAFEITATVLSLVTLVWSAYIYVDGLIVTRGVDGPQAVAIVGVLAVFGLIGII
jgi:hypothetical protein